MKSSTPASEAMAAAVIGLSPVTITVLMPIARSAAKRVLDVGLHDVLEMDDAEQSAVLGDRQRRAARVRAMRSTACRNSPGALDRQADLRMASTASTAPLRMLRPSRSTPEIRVCAENGTNRVVGDYVGLRKSVVALGQRDDRAAFRRLVGERRQQRRFREVALRHAGDRDEFGRQRLPKVIVPVLSSSSVSTSPAASTARPEVATTLKRIETVHAGDADGRQQAADRRRDEADEQRDEHGHRKIGRRIAGDGHKRHDRRSGR